ncbi:SDR family NAD(P)-dependent oxidoreductase [Streptomyces sp. Z26]|uniref:SDR family NAD(P)-dependent oxidoreductase n=1 Tax=Streptomyces sp. Z26 TaxID=2500177 RepID=UPI000EF16200|nr:SDR family NAD(P)-dependent oxidoreductase [Streptomyces sp. Z26]RLL68789.1 SDR family NAD(P)-dependent oxidoreductase [Streptomyces sp. Z26]
MHIHGATALVTGANRGFGRHLTEELLRRGAKVYATARRPELVDVPGARVLPLDITDQDSIDAVSRTAADVDLLINNGASTAVASLMNGDRAAIGQMIDTHFFGTLDMIRAFAPVLARNGGGAILNVLSLTAWTSVEANTALAAAKSAQWGLTNGVRLELAGQGTLVSALVPGLIGTATLREAMKDTGLTFSAEVMNDPAALARLALDGVEAGEVEILDSLGAEAKAALAGPPRTFDLAAVATR